MKDITQKEIAELHINEEAKLSTLPQIIVRIHKIVACIFELEDRIIELEKSEEWRERGRSHNRLRRQ